MVVFWLSVLACRGPEISIDVLPPEVTFVHPLDGDRFDPDTPVQLCADIEYSGTVDALEIELSSDLDGLIATDGFGPCEAGNVGLPWTFSREVRTLTLTATDATGRSGSDTITITPLPETPNTPPTCTIPSPGFGTVFEEGQLVDLAVLPEDVDGDPLLVKVASDVDGTLRTVELPAPASTSFDLPLTPGVHVLTVTVSDDREGVGTCSVRVEMSECADDDGDGFDVCEGDCDDNAPHTNPAASELPDGQDNDCDGVVDEGTALYDDDGDGVYELAGDCNDNDASINPDATDIPDDGIDQDCSGTDTVTCFVDADDDGYGSTDTTLGEYGDCDEPNKSDNADDCDDNDAGINPGAAEIVADGIDQDCDGVDPAGCYQDSDGDGYGTSVVLPPGDADCDDPGESPYQSDCDDAEATIHPGATEVVGDGEDQDCDGVDSIDCYEDADFDGFGDTAIVAHDGSCDPGQAESDVDGDCNDGDNSVYPGASDPPGDGIDQDCSGSDAALCFEDDDGDGWGTSTPLPADDGDCDDPGEASRPGDCADGDASVNPGGTEIPDDLIDQDCSGADLVTCYEDSDQDSFGSDATVLAPDGSCDTAESEADVNGDCDDTRDWVFPGGDDSDGTDGIDADCDGNDGYDIDDADGDGYAVPEDCDDDDASVNPGAAEIRDNADQDCDGLCDEGLINTGDLVITEVMVQPQASSATRGEWFELHNPTSTDIRMCGGWRFVDIGFDEVVVTGGLVVPAGGYIVAAGNGSPTQNGGVYPDFVYDRADLPFGDPDELLVEFDGLVIDQVVWLSEPEGGRAWQLGPTTLDAVSNDDPVNWCDAPTVWSTSAGDRGSPGEANPPCP